MEFLKRKPKVKPVMYEMGGGWGNRITWQDLPKRKIVGWKQRTPVVGDLIKCPMESGKDGLFRIISVDKKTDPPDMFFADTEPAGYFEDYKDEYITEKEERETRTKLTFLK